MQIQRKLLALCLMVALLIPMGALSEAAEISENSIKVSPTTGLPIEGEYRPLMLIISVEPAARPQWGLAAADVVYESVTYGGGFTRLNALYTNDLPERVGGIRSIRLHNVEIAADWGAALGHWGGQSSPGSDAYEYLAQLKSEGLIPASFDGLVGIKEMQRDDGRKSPNNVGANAKQLSEKMDPVQEPVSLFAFNEEGPQEGEDVSELSIYYTRLYDAAYQYNPETRLYTRFYAGKPHVDGNDDTPLTYSNVVVQHVDLSFFDGDSARPSLKVVGEGQADYFVGGKHVKGRWERESVDAHTRYLTAEGEEMQFLPGKTFVQMVDSSVTVKIGGAEAAAPSDEEAAEADGEDSAE